MKNAYVLLALSSLRRVLVLALGTLLAIVVAAVGVEPESAGVLVVHGCEVLVAVFVLVESLLLRRIQKKTFPLVLDMLWHHAMSKTSGKCAHPNMFLVGKFATHVQNIRKRFFCPDVSDMTCQHIVNWKLES